MKRGFCFCLSLFLLLTMVWVPVSAVEPVAKIEIRTPSVLPKAGETFEVVAYISNCSGVYGAELDLFAENDSLECTNIVLGEVFDAEFSVENTETYDGAARFSGVFNQVFSGDTVLATYTFVAKEDISSFDFKASSAMIIDFDANELPLQVIGAAEVIAENPSENDSVVPQEPAIEHLYADTVDHWAEEYINSATELGLFKGDNVGKFYPDDNVTRAQFVTVLWRMAGSPSVDKVTNFTDIDNQIPEFKTAIAWGFANGFINGTSKSTFDPDGFLTREAAMKMLHSYSGGKSGMEMMLASVYNGYFSDSSSISDWAKPSMYWGVYYKLISGTSQSTLSPHNSATRAQIAKILVNYINSIHIN